MHRRLHARRATQSRLHGAILRCHLCRLPLHRLLRSLFVAILRLRGILRNLRMNFLILCIRAAMHHRGKGPEVPQVFTAGKQLSQAQVRKIMQLVPVGGHLLVGRLIEALNRVLGPDGEAQRRGGIKDLHHEALGVGVARGGQLVRVIHLQASEVHVRPRVLKHRRDLRVGVAGVRVVVSCGGLCRMGLAVVPPVDAGDLARDLSPVLEYRLGLPEHSVAMVLESAGVPIQEKLAIRGLEARREKLRIVREVAVAASLVWRQRPIRSASGCGSRVQALKGMLIVTLELTDATIRPMAEAVRGIAQFTTRAHANHDLGDQAAQVVGELGGKGCHPIIVHLQGRAISNEHLVGEQRDVLFVLLAIGIGVPNALGLVDKVRQQDVARVANVAATLMERGHGLHLPIAVPGQLEHGAVGAEVVDLGALLGDAPPHIHHETVHARPLHRIEHLRKANRICDRAVWGDSVQGHHDEDLGAVTHNIAGHAPALLAWRQAGVLHLLDQQDARALGRAVLDTCASAAREPLAHGLASVD
mmetsp:Transcript_182786/g.579116  ORF Transcript_182786/g.579116 Transcript_182786/m.579116 type:complete len:530 (+) Transcript_182786:508-2097(+)